MYINSLELDYTGTPVYVYNTYNHMIYALDIYIVCKSSSLLNEILTPDESLPIGGSNASLYIDGVEFRLKFGSPGESALNPITYIRDSSIAKYIINDTVLNTKTGAFVGSYLNGTWEQGTNISNNDYVTMSYQQNSAYGKYKEVTGYGNYGFGEDITKIIGYGGVVLGTAEEDLYIVVEESKTISKDLLYYYIGIESDTKIQTSSGIAYDAFN